MGLSLSSDRFNKLVEDALAKEVSLKNFVKLMDDVLLYGKTLEELLEQLILFLKVCAENNLTVAPKKFQFAHPEEVCPLPGHQWEPKAWLQTWLRWMPSATSPRLPQRQK